MANIKRRNTHNELSPFELEAKIDVLNQSFAVCTNNAGDIIGYNANNNSELYRYQVDFAYLIHNIRTCPSYSKLKFIQEANDMITGIRALTTQ